MDSRLQQRDDDGFADVLPRQAKLQGIELSAALTVYLMTR